MTKSSTCYEVGAIILVRASVISRNTTIYKLCHVAGTAEHVASMATLPLNGRGLQHTHGRRRKQGTPKITCNTEKGVQRQPS